MADLVTVVVPAREEEASIGACLQSILNQDWPDLQVLVVDGASSDGTAAIIRSFARRDRRVEPLVNDDGTITGSLNLALRAARGRWFVRVDAHCVVPPDYVRRLVHHLQTGDFSGVGGRKDGQGTTAAGRAIATAMASPFGVGNSTYHHGRSVRTVDHIPFGAYPTALVRRLGRNQIGGGTDHQIDAKRRRNCEKIAPRGAINMMAFAPETVRRLVHRHRPARRAPTNCPPQ